MTTATAELTDDQKRVKIAKACGYKKIKPPTDQRGWGEGLRGNLWWYPHQLPDYLNDLNACYEMEKVLDGNRKTQFDNHIFQLCGSWSKAIHATARQRADAFLAVIS